MRRLPATDLLQTTMTLCVRSAWIGLGTALVLAALAPPARGRAVPGDAFLCAEARMPRAARGAAAPPKFHPRVAVPVIDRFTRPLPSGRYTLDLRRAEAFCRPVRIDEEDLTDPLHGLELYEARRTRRKPAVPAPPATTEEIETAFGSVRMRVGVIESLAVPTLAAGSVGGSGVARDHFTCYRGRPERIPGERQRGFRIAVRTTDGRRSLDVRKPIGVCVPASVRDEDPSAPKHPIDLLCYDARLVANEQDPPSAEELVATRNGFGHELLRVGAPEMLCVPAARPHVVVQTPTPFPTFTPPPTPVPTVTAFFTPRPPTVRIAPLSTLGLIRDRQCLTALLEHTDGSSVDVTATAVWRVIDGTIAVPAGFLDGKKCFAGVGIGTTTITARDPGTGVTSPPASFTAEWPIFKLTVNPKQLGMRIGETETLTVTASLTGDRTRNVTQHVRYETGNPGVIHLPNQTGNRSRVEAKSHGRTTITVHDTFSSIVDTINVAVGELQSVVVDPGPLLFPGETGRMKAVGVFSEGFGGNLTQIASWDSSDPGVAVATNTPGDRGRVEAVSPGTTVVNATDLLSGIRSTCCGTLSVLGDALDVVVTPTRIERRVGVDLAPVTLSARGFYAIPPNGSAARIVNDRVIWSSSDESVVAIGDLDADGRRQLLVVGSGEARVLATDPSNGVASPPATVTIYEHLDRVEVGTSSSDPAENDERHVVIGQSATFAAHGYFDGGRHRTLNDVQFVASDPDLVEISGRFVRGVRPGTITISAVDRPSGRSSADGGRNGILHIEGGIRALVLSPRTVALDLGRATTLTATGLHEGGVTENVTQRAIYTSNDPSVVVATNDFGNRSRIVAVGVGTATISARDPETDVTSTESDNDATVTVRDGTLVRIVVSPRTVRMAASSVRRFTAVGHLANGDTVNLTQRVEWISSDHAVAVPTNVTGDRSRFDVLAPGTALVSARDPETELLSTDTGDDATLTVGVLTAITITPAATTLTVGDRFSLTTLGTLDGSATVNLTQDVVYASSDPSVVRATNAAGNRSQIEAVAPGVAVITAFRASTFPQVTDSDAATVTVVAGD